MSTHVFPSSIPSRSELKVITMVSDGLAYKEIATALGVTPGTVGNHMQGLYLKLNAHNSLQAYRILIEQGYIHIDAPPLSFDSIAQIIARVTSELHSKTTVVAPSA